MTELAVKENILSALLTQTEVELGWKKENSLEPASLAAREEDGLA